MNLIRAEKEDAAAALQLEETLLAHHRLAAPFDAVIVARHAEPGTVVKSGDPIFTLIDPTTVWIQTYIDEERAGQLALGQRERSGCAPGRRIVSTGSWQGSASRATA